ncbi:hypothetical protein BU14_0692s0005 [Porphyra umbilicalis]|uniref:Fatty acid hydroxylase domain-containing protein n=1 Tax=Porphyra umbilicalis TaxID=2786 RepID=A0A1X6NQ14_PORUM|nr:hypothetical protein BU14_0692s0005 [Porphyra umbilicalis]|eukprot:OSX70672.1 hypothetical protein BU14_0692s0005 [Porphyra umbilicalis]
MDVLSFAGQVGPLLSVAAPPGLWAAAHRVLPRLPPPTVAATAGGSLPRQAAAAAAAAAAACRRAPACATAADWAARTARVWATNYTVALALFLLVATADYLVAFHLLRGRCHPGYTLDRVAARRLARHAAHSVWSLAVMAALAAPWDVAAAAGADRRFDTFAQQPGGAAATAATAVLFIAVGETYSYWLHRGMHTLPVLSTWHAAHHGVGAPTPFAAFAFHPLDGYAQGLYFHAFPFFVPVHRGAYAAFMGALSLWSVLVHDGVGEGGGGGGSWGGGPRAPPRGGGNFGQFTMTWDWACGTLVGPGEDYRRRRGDRKAQ